MCGVELEWARLEPELPGSSRKARLRGAKAVSVGAGSKCTVPLYKDNLGDNMAMLLPTHAVVATAVGVSVNMKSLAVGEMRPLQTGDVVEFRAEPGVAGDDIPVGDVDGARFAYLRVDAECDTCGAFGKVASGSATTGGKRAPKRVPALAAGVKRSAPTAAGGPKRKRLCRSDSEFLPVGNMGEDSGADDLEDPGRLTRSSGPRGGAAEEEEDLSREMHELSASASGDGEDIVVPLPSPLSISSLWSPDCSDGFGLPTPMDVGGDTGKPGVRAVDEDVSDPRSRLARLYAEYFRSSEVAVGNSNVSLASTPYNIPLSVKHALLSSVSTFLLHPDRASLTKRFHHVGPNILFMGPPGSERAQEALVRGLAAETGASLLVVDPKLLPDGQGTVLRPCETCGLPYCVRSVVSKLPAGLQDALQPHSPSDQEGSHAAARSVSVGSKRSAASGGKAAAAAAASSGTRQRGTKTVFRRGGLVRFMGSPRYLKAVSQPGGPPIDGGGGVKVTAVRAPATVKVKKRVLFDLPDAVNKRPGETCNYDDKDGDVRRPGTPTPAAPVLTPPRQGAGGRGRDATGGKSSDKPSRTVAREGTGELVTKGRRGIVVGSSKSGSTVYVCFDVYLVRYPRLLESMRPTKVLEVSSELLVPSSSSSSRSNSTDALQKDCYTTAAVTGLLSAICTRPTAPRIVFIRDVEKLCLTSYSRYSLFKEAFSHMAEKGFPTVVIASHTTGGVKRSGSGVGLGPTSITAGSTSLFLPRPSSITLDLGMIEQFAKSSERSSKQPPRLMRALTKLFPSKVSLVMPESVTDSSWAAKEFTEEVGYQRQEANLVALRQAVHLAQVAVAPVGPPRSGGDGSFETASRATCYSHAALRKGLLTTEQTQRIVSWALAHQLRRKGTVAAEADGSREDIVLDGESLSYALTLHQMQEGGGGKGKLEEMDLNEFEKRISAEVVAPSEIGVRWSDVGALDDVKKALREIVMLPLQRPEFFRKGCLSKPCKGILLFGPPGTGKTLMAKAVATASGAYFMNISMSVVGSKWFGEGEKYVKAVFSLASRLAPCVIFIDEVDSMLGKREKLGEHEAMRKIKNEFMSMWDGLKSDAMERVLIMGATNRPFDLDEAVLRRMPRRLLVDIPDEAQRETILRVILADEDLVPGFSYKELAAKTKGFTGSDLRNLSAAAAYQRVREFIKEEGGMDTPMDAPIKADVLSSESGLPELVVAAEEREEKTLRHVTLADFEAALEEVRPSVHEDAFSISELRRWNAQYGVGGNAATTLSYFM